jgi:DNA-binding transcriptional LysR family regulator
LLTALEDRKSLSGAADEIGMTQPAASKSLKELEELLGLELFLREGRGIAITPHGAAVTAYAKMVFDRLGELREELVSIERADIGRVRIGAVSATTAVLLTEVIVRLTQSHPRLNLMIQVETSDLLMQALDDERVDLVIGMIPGGRSPQQYVYEPLAEEGLSVVVRPEHPVARDEAAPGLASLLAYRWILHPYTSPMRQLIDDAFLRARVTPPDNVVETSSMLTTVSVVMGSDIVSVMPAPVARFFSDRGVLKILPIEVQRRWAPYGLIMQKDKRLTPALNIVIDAIRACSKTVDVSASSAGELLA